MMSLNGLHDLKKKFVPLCSVYSMYILWYDNSAKGMQVKDYHYQLKIDVKRLFYDNIECCVK